MRTVVSTHSRKTDVKPKSLTRLFPAVALSLVALLSGCVPSGVLDSGIYANVPDETLCWQARNGLEEETKFERMRRFLNCSKYEHDRISASDQKKFEAMPESQKIAASSDVRICQFATDNGKWTQDVRWQDYVREAQRRGIDCGTKSKPKRSSSIAKQELPQTNFNSTKPKSSELRTSRATQPSKLSGIRQVEAKYGRPDETDSYENNVVMKYCDTGFFKDEFVYVWMQAGEVKQIKTEEGSRPGKCVNSFRMVDWTGTLSQNYLILGAMKPRSGGGWDAVAEEFLIQQQRSQQQLNNSLMESFENRTQPSLETLERNRSIDCMSRGGAYVGGVCRFN